MSIKGKGYESLTCSIKSTVGSTLHVVGAKCLIKGVASVAVGVSISRVQPTPVCVEYNGCVHCLTLTSGGTLLVAHGRVGLSSRGASLLSENAMARRAAKVEAEIIVIGVRRVDSKKRAEKMSDLSVSRRWVSHIYMRRC
jgi:hypothetical protein